MDPPVYNPAIPYNAVVMGGFNQGRMLKVHGQAHPGARCFAINLQCGPNVNPRDDIALHLSPVFTSPPRLVRNSLQGQMWGPEESYGPYFPFSAGSNFEILLLAENDHFKIAVNGQHFTEFHYRVPSQRITHIAIDGDTMVSMIEFSGTSVLSPGYGAGSPYGAPSPAFPGIPPVPPTTGYSYGPPPFSGGAQPYPQQSGGYPSQPSGYPSQPSGFPSQPGGYPSQPGGYPSQPGGYPAQSGGYPTQQGYPSQAYPHSPNTAQKMGLGAALTGGLGAAALGAAASNLLGGGHHKSHHRGGIGGALSSLPLAAGLGAGMLGGHHGHKHKKHSKAIPIGLGVGAGALAGAALLGHNPLKPKKLKKLYKHKGFKHKHKHGFGFHGRSSSSSSSD